MQSKKQNKNINRRNFLKIAGTGAAATGATLIGCSPNTQSNTAGRHLSEVPTDQMTYRINPHSGDKISLLGYGCMRWPLRPAADGGEEIDQDAVNELVDYAIAHGVNYFDVAPTYVRGLSEVATGIALKRHPRESFFIATKLSTHPDNRELRTFEGSVALYKRSFERLQVDYIDYYLLHGMGIGGMEAMNERLFDNGMLDYLIKEKEAGRIRNLGFSFHGDVAVFDYLLAMDIQWDFCQIQLNYLDWQNATGWNVNAEYLNGKLIKKNIPAIIMEPLLGGRLARLNSVAQAPLRRIRPDDTPATWAFRYAGTPENVITVLSGMVYMEHLQENIRTYSPLDPLTPSEYEALEEVTEIMLNDDFIPCTECQYCMPCPYGINIPAVFAHYNKVVNAQRMPESAGDPNYRKYRREFLIGYDRSVPKLRQADHCIGCKICTHECPQRIAIPEEMQRIDQFVETLKQDATI
ncbi:MAG: aldo/keto reductase [Tannerellaceae bacterium]|nr:aldo/keto reductase [Tannerellaceae bacterium]